MSLARPTVVALLAVVALLGGCERAGTGPRPEGNGGTFPEAGRVVFVSPAGDDGSAGSFEAPWRTLGVALGRLGPGDRLVVRGGRYEERITDIDIRGGTEAAPIVVEAHPGERPVLAGLLWLRDADHWTIRGLQITWHPTGSPDEHMVKMIGGTGWALTGNELWGARSFAALLVAAGSGGEPAHWRVAGNCIHDTLPTNEVNQDQLIYVNTGLEAGPGVVVRNILYGAPNGMGVKLGGPREDSGGAARVAVIRNTIVDTSQSVLVAWRSTGNRIERNLLYGVGEGYANIRGYQLEGRDNLVARNAGGGASALILNDDGDYRGLAVSGDNLFPIDPDFVSHGCDGFEPGRREVRAYGARS